MNKMNEKYKVNETLRSDLVSDLEIIVDATLFRATERQDDSN